MKEKTSEKVLKYIQKMIIQKQWEIGDKITSEIQLAKELEVSRISVREAIGSLVTLNILEKKRGGGTFVKQLTPNDYMTRLIPLLTIGEISYLEIIETRLALDSEAVRLFIENGDLNDIKQLGKIMKKMIRSKEKPSDFYTYDMEFHRFIAEKSKNKILSKITELLAEITSNYVKEEYHSLTYEERINEHKLIYEAIKNKDILLAQIYSKRHLERSINDLKKK